MIIVKNTVDIEEKVAISKIFDSHNLYYLLEDNSPLIRSASHADMLGNLAHGPYIFRVNDKDHEKALNLLKGLVSEPKHTKNFKANKSPIRSVLVEELKLFISWITNRK